MESKENIKHHADELAAYMEEAMVSVTSSYLKDPEVLKIQDTVIGTLGNFSASIGKAKSKKTFNVSALVAAALSNGTVLQYQASFPDNKRKILYIDTEQGKNHCLKVLKRILRLANLPMDVDPENLRVYALRKYSPEIRLQIIQHAIEQEPNLGLVIIDGIRDLMYDINSPSEATNTISNLMQWTDDKQIHIHTILHQNKNDEHARGHIGTELSNKAETIIQVEVDKDDSNISTVTPVHIRDREFSPFAFRINEESLPELVELKSRQSGRKAKDPFDPYKEISEQQHRQALANTFINGDIPRYDELIKKLKEGYLSVGIKLNNNKCVTLVTFLRNKRMVVAEDKVYKLVPDFHY